MSSTAQANEGEKILIVDDDARLRRLLERFLDEQGYRVRTVENTEQMDRLLSRELFQLVVNVGDARSLVSHPATMTHCRLTRQQREAAGIAETTVRLSIGLECPDDLIADLDRALAVVSAAGPAVPATTPAVPETAAVTQEVR